MSPIQPGLEAEDTREPRAEQPIVVGIDGSPGAVAALRWAAVEARTHGRRLTAVYAYDPVVYGAPMPPMAGIPDLVMAGGEARLDEALLEVFGDQRPTEVTRVVREGNPARVLVEIATDASLLVVGARGHGHFLLGSVSDRCVHHANCPVVVVHY